MGQGTQSKTLRDTFCCCLMSEAKRWDFFILWLRYCRYAFGKLPPETFGAAMTKLLLPALFALLYAFPAFADTNTFPLTGSVGIGTTSPTDTLEVLGGEILIDNSGYGRVLFAQSGTNIWSAGPRNSTDWYLYRESGAGNILFPSGNVGIGTSSPANLLDLGSGGGIHLTSGVPSSTSNALYNNSGSLAWNGALVISSAGRLQCGATCTGGGTTSLSYCPYKGNVKTTASQGNYTIPSGCLTATTTSMYVGGVGSTSLSANTLYYIYLWNNSGTWVLDAETGGHAADSSTGIEIKSGDNTKTLVGMVHTNGSKTVATGGTTTTGFIDTNTVATWDNRIPTATTCGFTATRTASNHSSFAEVNSENRCYFMSWGDAAQFSSSLMGYGSTTSCAVETAIFIDSVSGADPVQLSTYTPGNQISVLTSGTATTTEGYHFTILGALAPSTCTSTYVTGGETVYSVQ
jgi:hypothetical protein